MKVLDRLDLIDRIGRALQSRMSYSEIDGYLKAHGVDVNKKTSDVNSKWVYTKELLSGEKDSLIIAIADEINVPHDYVVAENFSSIEPTFWHSFHFRLFLSHLSCFKKNTGQLQKALLPYGISAFVAHVDIEPTREWLTEIEAGLHTMDAMAAILMPGFKESSWTDQEVGFAVGRGVLIIPVMKGLEPYGFISKYQGLYAEGKTVGYVADSIFRILVKSPKTRARIISCLVDSTLHSSSVEDALEKLKHITSIDDMPASYLEKLREGAKSTLHFSSGQPLRQLNALLIKRNLKPVALESTLQDFVDEDIPF